MSKGMCWTTLLIQAQALKQYLKERGDCPQHALPVLAAYMGHRVFQYTAKYLKFIDAEQRQGLYDFAISQKVDIWNLKSVFTGSSNNTWYA